MSDLIDRQAAIDVVNSHRYVYENKHLNDYEQGWNDACDYCADEWLDDFPSAQQEPLTDIEQRIFLSAMGREYKICKKVDEEYYGIDNINLVRVCREIERKVKKALWTN